MGLSATPDGPAWLLRVAGWPRLRSPLGLPVLRLVPIVCMPSPIPRQDRWDSSLISHRRRPSLDSRRVGSCITRFGACTAFTIITAYKLAKSPTWPSTSEASAASLPPLLLRLLPGGANQFPGGINPRFGPAPFHGAREGRVSSMSRLSMQRVMQDPIPFLILFGLILLTVWNWRWFKDR